MPENTTPKQLIVFVNGALSGYLHDTIPLSFSYSDDALNELIFVPFSVIIPLRAGKINSIEVLSFFENLLPEGDQRTILEMRYHATSVFGLLSEVGLDTAGSVVIAPIGSELEPAGYKSSSWADIKKMITGSLYENDAMPSIANHAAISGAQNKMLLSIDADGNPLIPLGASISTHILKLDIIRPGSKIWGSASNETLMMKTAKLCGLPVADVSYIPEVNSCLVKRYDRVYDAAAGCVSRIYQADLCQILGKPSAVKYENDGGPSFKECYLTVKERSNVPSVDASNLLKWLFFNLYTGNNDSHAKNLSMLADQGGGMRLAPFYDLMCTRAYSGLSINFAFKIGSHYQAGLIESGDISLLASEIGVKDRYIFDIAKDMSNKVIKHVQIAANELSEIVGYNDKIVIERITQSVLSIAKKMESRLVPDEKDCEAEAGTAASASRRVRPAG
jgi:serine/threonine-protein kinase HipA